MCFVPRSANFFTHLPPRVVLKGDGCGFNQISKISSHFPNLGVSIELYHKYAECATMYQIRNNIIRVLTESELHSSKTKIATGSASESQFAYIVLTISTPP